MQGDDPQKAQSEPENCCMGFGQATSITPCLSSRPSFLAAEATRACSCDMWRWFRCSGRQGPSFLPSLGQASAAQATPASKHASLRGQLEMCRAREHLRRCRPARRQQVQLQLYLHTVSDLWRWCVAMNWCQDGECVNTTPKRVQRKKNRGSALLAGFAVLFASPPPAPVTRVVRPCKPQQLSPSCATTAVKAACSRWLP